ncbi:MAG: hypothetical protein ACXVH7_12085 [Thermoanaerobaculia bacterium]
MESGTIAQLLDEYRSHAAAHCEPNDGTQSWVSRVNHAADQMLLIARRVADAGPGAVARFSELVDAADPRLSISAAHHVLDFMQPSANVRDAALAVIEREAQRQTPEAPGERLWLDNWRAEQQDE